MAGRRVELGFEGGTVIRLTLEDPAVGELTQALGGEEGWRSVESEEGTTWLNLGELVYLRLAPGEAPARVGFAGA